MSQQFHSLISNAFFICLSANAFAQSPPLADKKPEVSSYRLSEDQSEMLDQTVERAISYLASKQLKDGSFSAPAFGQPGISSLCCIAMLSAGSIPGESKHGAQLEKAIDFVLSTQREDGLFSYLRPEAQYRPNSASHAALYNHAIAGLLLTEVYGMTSAAQSKQIELAIPRALAFSRNSQTQQKRRKIDIGGWKYLRHSPHTPSDSDLSVTAWQIMFLRSAKNAEFEVPAEYVEDAVKYVSRCFDKSQQQFFYGIREPQPYTSRGVIGAGIFALALAGEHETESARLAATKLLKRPFRYNEVLTPYEQYHYTIYHCSQAMFQLGDRYWFAYFPPLLKSLAENQRPDGSWPASRGWEKLGSPYTVALTVLALTPQYQILPIYQR